MAVNNKRIYARGDEIYCTHDDSVYGEHMGIVTLFAPGGIEIRMTVPRAEDLAQSLARHVKFARMKRANGKGRLTTSD